MNRDESMSAREAASLAVASDEAFRWEEDWPTVWGLWCAGCNLPSAVEFETRVYWVRPDKVTSFVSGTGSYCPDCGEFVGSRNA